MNFEFDCPKFLNLKNLNSRLPHAALNSKNPNDLWFISKAALPSRNIPKKRVQPINSKLPNIGIKKIHRSASRQFSYEPCLFSTRRRRQWQRLRGQSWRALSTQERQRANQQMRELQLGNPI